MITQTDRTNAPATEMTVNEKLCDQTADTCSEEIRNILKKHGMIGVCVIAKPLKDLENETPSTDVSARILKLLGHDLLCIKDDGQGSLKIVIDKDKRDEVIVTLSLLNTLNEYLKDIIRASCEMGIEISIKAKSIL